MNQRITSFFQGETWNESCLSCLVGCWRRSATGAASLSLYVGVWDDCDVGRGDVIGCLEGGVAQ